MERWADPHAAPQGSFLPVGAGAVLVPQNPWEHTLSWSQLHMTPGRAIPFTTALLPESRVLYVSAPPPPSWAWGWAHRWKAQVRSWCNCVGTILQCARDQTNPLATGAAGALEWLCRAMPAVWRGARDQLAGAGSTCETRQEAAGSSRQESEDEAVTLCCQDAMGDALAQRFPVPRG